MIPDIDIAIRGYVVHEKSNPSLRKKGTRDSPDIVAVFDTETTADAYLNLKFGSFGVWVAGKLDRFIIFYSDKIGKKEQAILRNHVRSITVENVKVQLLPLDRFIHEAFYPVVYYSHALLVGFNLPFDISRLAYRYGMSKRWKKGFTFYLTKNRFRPQIRIMSLDTTKAFIEFAKPPKRNKLHKRFWYKGRFLDLHTLGFALTNESLSLESACKLFQTEICKHEAEEHGRINAEYIDYNVRDTISSYSLYSKMIERYKSFHLDLQPEKIYSPATIGKQYLKQIGNRSFLEQNPNFPPELLGKIMTTYFGGRSEVRVRKKPVKIRYMDFTSMYPSLFSIMNLWPLVIANEIEATDVTDQARRMIKNANLETLRNPTFWKNMITIVQVKPVEDILPARAHYGDKQAYNIGLPYLTSNRSLWHALPDVIAGKLFTGKSPKIICAIQFVPKGKKTDLKTITIVRDLTISPDEDLFLKLRQLRVKIQKDRDRQDNSAQYSRLETVQKQLKILANATSYGIFIEVNTEDQKCQAKVYGLGEPFTCEASKKETFGYFFNPIISTMLTSGARLLLAMAETWLVHHGGYYTFCDTDSMAVSPFHWKKLQEYFEPLNPIPEEPGFLKLEKENYDEHGKPRDLWFYGISAKRYVLYIINEHDEPIPVKWSSHGLGHLMHGRELNWEKQLWINILFYAHGKITKEELLKLYANDYAVSKLAISTPTLLRRVKAINKDMPYEQQIKPFNFVLVGSPTMTIRNRPIIPLTSFTTPNLAPYQMFVDANTGKLYSENMEAYWKNFEQTIEEYLDHPESKFENGDCSGTMRRMHLNVNSIHFIGKESNELQETEIVGLDEESYVHYLPDVPDTVKPD
jgi:hypothetical protein